MYINTFVGPTKTYWNVGVGWYSILFLDQTDPDLIQHFAILTLEPGQYWTFGANADINIIIPIFLYLQDI